MVNKFKNNSVTLDGTSNKISHMYNGQLLSLLIYRRFYLFMTLQDKSIFSSLIMTHGIYIFRHSDLKLLLFSTIIIKTISFLKNHCSIYFSWFFRL